MSFWDFRYFFCDECAEVEKKCAVESYALRWSPLPSINPDTHCGLQLLGHNEPPLTYSDACRKPATQVLIANGPHRCPRPTESE